MSTDGRLEAIWVKRSHGGLMDPAPVARLEAGAGIAGNADRGGRRQVTIIEREVWDEVTAALEAPVEPAARRANFMINGLPLAGSRDRILEVGVAAIRILGETKPCALMEQTQAGLRQALYNDWHGGAFGEVLEGGDIAVGDAVRWRQP